MFYQPAHVLLIAMGLALVLPEPRRWNPFALARAGARALGRDLPQVGWAAAAAGVMLLALIAAPAAGVAWGLTYALPVGLRLVAPDASPIVALVLAAILLRLTFEAPPLWEWRSKLRSGRGPEPAEPLARFAAGFGAPLLLFSLLGLYGPIVYRAAFETAHSPTDPERKHPVTWAAWLLMCAAAAPTHRLLTLFSLLARRGGPPTTGRTIVAAAVATIALALLIAVW